MPKIPRCPELDIPKDTPGSILSSGIPRVSWSRCLETRSLHCPYAKEFPRIAGRDRKNPFLPGEHKNRLPGGTEALRRQTEHQYARVETGWRFRGVALARQCAAEMQVSRNRRMAGNFEIDPYTANILQQVDARRYGNTRTYGNQESTGTTQDAGGVWNGKGAT